MTTARTLRPYRLPDGEIVQVDDSAAQGAPVITYTLKGGAIVEATREPWPPADWPSHEERIAAAFPAFVQAVSHLRACWDALARVELTLGQDYDNMTRELGDCYGGNDVPPELDDFRDWIAALRPDGEPYEPICPDLTADPHPDTDDHRAGCVQCMHDYDARQPDSPTEG